MSLNDPDAFALLERFISADESTRKRWAWNAPPPFLIRTWQTAKDKEARAARTAKATAEKRRKHEATWIFDDDKEEDPRQQPNPPEHHQSHKLWGAMTAAEQQAFSKRWASAEKDDHAEAEVLQDDDEVALRRSAATWLHRRNWGPRELHDALVSLGTAVPRKAVRHIYMARLRSICTDTRSMTAPGGQFQVPALKAALSTLKLGTTGRKAQLAERLYNAVHETDDGDTLSQDAGNATAIVDTETDMARCPKVRDFEARAAAAWQEHSSDGAFMLDDLLDTGLDAEEEDVRAEQEALLQLEEGVNPPSRQLLSPSSSNDSLVLPSSL